MPGQAIFSCWVIDGDKTLPLLTGRSASQRILVLDMSLYLDRKRLIFCNTQAYALTLCVEGIEVNVRDDPERASSRRECELRKVFVSESRFPEMAG